MILRTGMPIAGVISLSMMGRCPSAPTPPLPPMDFEQWVTNREPFIVVAPVIGTSSDMNRWITNREPFRDTWR